MHSAPLVLATVLRRVELVSLSFVDFANSIHPFARLWMVLYKILLTEDHVQYAKGCMWWLSMMAARIGRAQPPSSDPAYLPGPTAGRTALLFTNRATQLDRACIMHRFDITDTTLQNPTERASLRR